MTKVSDYKLTGLVKQKVGKENEILRKVRLLVPAQNANISPPIGPILGQFGINIMEFCKQFNERSKYIDSEVLVLVVLTLYRNKTFTFDIKTPPITFLVNEESNMLPENLVPRYVDLSSLYKICQVKNFSRLSDYQLSQFRSIFGTLRSMHLQVCNDLNF